MMRPTASLWLQEKLHLILFYERRGVFWRKVNFNILQKNPDWIDSFFITTIVFFIYPALLASAAERERSSGGSKSF